MITMKEYAGMSAASQENFLAHASADLVQRMYYENDRKGLEVVIKNLMAITNRARDCLSCLEMLAHDGDVYSKIYLLVEYAGRNGISEEFVSGLEELTERAQETLAKMSGVIPAADEEREVLKRLGAVIDNKTADNSEHDTKANPLKPDTTTAAKPEQKTIPVHPVNSGMSAKPIEQTGQGIQTIPKNGQEAIRRTA